MLEEAAEHAPDRDPLAQARHARAQDADPARDGLDGRPGADAAYSASTISGSTRRVHLDADPRRVARLRGARVTRSISWSTPSRRNQGPTRSFRNTVGRMRPVTALNTSATSAAISSSAVNRLRFVRRRVRRVVVPGADVDVPARRRARAGRAARASRAPSGRARRRRRGRPRGSSARDHSMLRRSSKRALSSTRQTACFRPRPLDERRDRHGRVARPVDGRLQRHDLGLARGDERLDARVERVVRVVDEEVAAPDPRRAARPACACERAAVAGRQGCAEVGPVEARELGERAVRSARRSRRPDPAPMASSSRAPRRARRRAGSTSSRTTSPNRRRRSSVSSASSRSSASLAIESRRHG